MLEAMPVAMGERFTVHVAELPGTGRSGGNPAEQSVATVVAAVDEVATQLADRASVVVFGHSMNGALALACAAATNYAGVIAVTPPASLPGDTDATRAFWTTNAEPERRRRADELIAAYNASEDAEEKEEISRSYNRLRQWFDLDFDPTALDALEKLDHDSAWIAAMFADAATVDWPGAIASVRCPVLLALGAYDFMAPPTLWDDAAMPQRSTVEVFSRSSHNPYVEQPDEFVAAVDRWLAANF
jgi:pimeloyl-ACP methyl ester carboxylesterase